MAENASPVDDGSTHDPAAWEPIPGRCNSRKTDGSGLCRNSAGKGTDHKGYGQCVKHGGCTPNAGKAAAKAMAVAVVEKFGLPREVHPLEAVREELWRTAGAVTFYEEILRSQGAEFGSDGLVWGVVQEVDKSSGEHPGVDVTRAAKPNVYLQLYRDERAQYFKIAADMVRLGFEEREVRVTEGLGQHMARVLSAVLTDLGHDPADEAVRRVVRLHLLPGGAA